MPVTVVPGRAELLALVDDPFVRAELPDGAPVRAWSSDGAVAFVRWSPVSEKDSLAVLGSDHAAADLAASLLLDGSSGGAAAVPGITMSAGARDGLLDRLAGAGDGAPVLRSWAWWDWMDTTTQPPAVPGEDAVRLLAPSEHDEVAELLEAASPRRSAEPEDDHVMGWWGVREAGRLLAVAAWSEHTDGVPHVESVATLPSARGRGLGAAVTVAVTRAALEAAGWCTLGMYADNDAARRLYHRLGFVTRHQFASAPVVRDRGVPT